MSTVSIIIIDLTTIKWRCNICIGLIRVWFVSIKSRHVYASNRIGRSRTKTTNTLIKSDNLYETTNDYCITLLVREKELYTFVTRFQSKFSFLYLNYTNLSFVIEEKWIVEYFVTCFESLLALLLNIVHYNQSV